MIKNVLLYGDIVPFAYSESEIDLQTFIGRIELLNLTKDDTLRVSINTLGGCTVTAFGIYNYLRRMVNSGEVKSIITRIDGYCASSGVIVLLSGDVRVGNKFANPFIHEAWTYLDSANASDLTAVVEDLTRTNHQIATLYSNVTSITVEEALTLMSNDTWVTIEDCLKYGFYTELENVEGAEASKDTFNTLKASKGLKVNNTKLNNMSKKKSFFNQMKDFMKSFQNKIILEASGIEIEFADLEDDATPAIGDKATIEGKPAGDFNGGEVTLADGTVYKFSGDELTEIVKPEAEPENSTDDTPEEDEKDKKIAELERKLEELTTNNEAQVTSFNTLQTKFNKVKEERGEAVKILTKINSIKDEQLKAILDGEEPTEDKEDGEFPEDKPARTTQNSAKDKPSELSAMMEEIKLNMLHSIRK